MRGAVQDFSVMVGRQVFITWGKDQNLKGCGCSMFSAPRLCRPRALQLFAEDPQYPSWIMRK